MPYRIPTFQIPREEYEQRVNAIKNFMRQKNIDALLVFGDGGISTGNVRYISNWYSLSIYNQSLLILPLDSEPTLLMRLQPHRAKQISWIDDIRESGKPSHNELLHDCKDILNTLHLKNGRIGLVGSVEETWRGIFDRRLKRAFPKAVFESADYILSMQRLVKSSMEIEMMKISGSIVDASLQAFRKQLRLGSTDFEAIAYGEWAARTRGTEDMLNFVGVSPRGEFAPPISLAAPSGRKFKRNDVVIVEFNECYGGYRTESVRMASFGKPTNEEKAIFEAVGVCYETFLQKAKPGRTIAEVAEKATKALMEIGYQPQRYVQRTHTQQISVGHGIGLDMFENPLLSTDNDTVLKPGMTFVLHPGLFGAFFGNKWGALFGDTLTMTESGIEPIHKMEWATNEFAII